MSSTENTRTALIVVDVQNDFCEGGSLAVTGGHDVAAGITAHLEQTRDRYAAVVASRDWHHPHGTNDGHFAAPGADPDYATTWPAHCVAGTPGAEYAPALDTGLVTHHVHKGQGIPAYSAFQGVLADTGRPVADLLAGDLEVTHLDVAGIATDYCVKATCLDAVEAGFAVRLLVDLCAGVAPETTQAALAELTAAGVSLT